MATATVDNIFANMVSSRDYTKYTLTARGVTDFTNVKQFNMYEKGYPVLCVTKIPEMLTQLANSNTEYATLVNNFRHLLEYDFRGLDGLEDMSVETQEISNGINKINIITKVNAQDGGNFSMKFQERQGSVFTRMNELYLRGIKDPRTQVKRYNGLLKTDGTSTIESGYENEVFEFLYFVTDNTARYIEKAFLIAVAQIQGAELSMYGGDRGQIEFVDLNLQFSGFPITNPLVTYKAQQFLNWINTQWETQESKFGYTSLSALPDDPSTTGTIQVASPKISYS